MDRIAFKNRAELSTHFRIVKNRGGGNCLFYSIDDLMNADQSESEERASLLRHQVCDFYAELFEGMEDDGTDDPYDLPKLRGMVHRHDPGMPKEDVDHIALSFANKDEMRDHREIGKKRKKETVVVPHYRSICDDGEYASALDLFIMSLLLNVDIYTFVQLPGRIELIEASFRTAPTDALFILQTGGRYGHFEALVPQCADGLFRAIPADSPRSLERIQQLWPALFEKIPTKTENKSKKIANTTKKAAKVDSADFESYVYNPADFESYVYNPADFESPSDAYNPADDTRLFKKRPPKASKYDGGRSSRRTRGRRRLSGLSVHARSRRLSRR
jgi:hypothetical protein